MTDEMCLKLGDLKISDKSGQVMSKQDQTIMSKGQDGQGESLMKSKNIKK